MHFSLLAVAAALASLVSFASAAPSPGINVRQDGRPDSLTPRLIHPNGDQSKCLSVDGMLANGTEVIIRDCNGKNGTTSWTITPGSTKVRNVDPTGMGPGQWCIDAGVPPFDNGHKLQIWECFDGLAQQQWFYTDDKHFALENQDNWCMDLTDGSKDNGNQMQIWKCFNFNSNQVWTIQ